MPHIPIRFWLQAARPHTLPLSAACVCMGGILAAQQHLFRLSVFAAALAVTLLLQVFANLANDYGDGLRGTDRHRSDRLFGRGIPPQALRRALLFCGGLCAVCGLILLSLAEPASGSAWLWLPAGAASLAAAWCYTAGRRPYGYAGWGDAAVWLFFGLLAVGGGGMLHGSRPALPDWAAANAVGLCCAAVLNVNNLRDLDTDRAAGKRTVAVRLGARRARRYQAALLAAASVCWGIWLAHAFSPAAAAMLSLLPPLYALRHLHRLRRAARPAEFNRLLAGLSRGIFLWIAALWWPAVYFR